jgi:hypothetical protein
MRRQRTVGLLGAILLPATAIGFFVFLPVPVKATTNCTLNGQQYSPGACVRNFAMVCSDPDSVCRCDGDGSWLCCASDCSSADSTASRFMVR